MVHRPITLFLGLSMALAGLGGTAAAGRVGVRPNLLPEGGGWDYPASFRRSLHSAAPGAAPVGMTGGDGRCAPLRPG